MSDDPLTAYYEGVPVMEICRKFQISTAKLYERLREKGGGPNRKTGEQSRQKDEEVAELLRAGLRAAEIARRFRVSRQRIHQRMKRRGLSGRRGKGSG